MSESERTQDREPREQRFSFQTPFSTNDDDATVQLRALSAAMYGDVDIVRQLLDRGVVDPAALIPGEDGNLLHVAAIRGQNNIIRLLLQYCPCLETKNHQGRTALALAAEYGRDATVQFLLQCGANIEQTDEFGRTPLWLAVQFNQSSTIRLLHRSGANLGTGSEEAPPLFEAVAQGHREAIEALLDCGVEVDSRNKSNATALMLAAVRGLFTGTMLLLCRGADVDAAGDEGMTALHIAAQQGHFYIVHTLLDFHARIEKTNNTGRTPLIVAAQSGKNLIVLLLLLHGADLEAEDENGQQALHFAATSDQVDVIDTLLEHDADIEAADHEQLTPLLVAVLRGSDLAVPHLIARGANVGAKDASGKSCLHHAIASSHVDLMEMLLAHGVDIDAKDSEGFTPLTCAALVDDSPAALECLIRHGADLASRDGHNQTALHTAAMHGSTEIARTILKHRAAGLEEKDGAGATPLLLAARYGHGETVQMLVGAGANIEERTNDGATALVLAAQYAHDATMQLLMSLGADSDACDNLGMKCLHIATWRGHEQTVRSILTIMKVDIESPCQSGRTALILAAEYGHVPMIALLVDKGASLQAKDHDGWTALHYAARLGHDSVVQALMGYGDVVVDQKQDSGYTASALAIDHGHETTVELLFQMGASAETKTNDGSNPMHLACRRGHLRIVKAISGTGFEPGARDNNGDSYLHLAARKGHNDVADFLLEFGSEIDAVNGKGYSPLVHAVSHGHAETVVLLIERGANVRLKTTCGCNLLHYAVKSGQGIVSQALLDRGANPEEKDCQGRTAFALADELGMSSMSQLLMNFAQPQQPTVQRADTMTSLGHIRTIPNDYSGYAPLDSARSEIRLLRIESFPREDGSGHGLACSVVKTSLLDHPPYSALSYVWGDLSDTVPIKAHFRDISHVGSAGIVKATANNSKLTHTDAAFNITRNLYNALRGFQHHKGPTLIWTDMMCINQGDLSERSEQVAMMSSIYAAAANVVVWLGGDPNGESDLFSPDEDEDLEIFLRILDRHTHSERTRRLRDRWQMMMDKLGPVRQPSAPGLGWAASASRDDEESGDLSSQVSRDLFTMYHADTDASRWLESMRWTEALGLTSTFRRPLPRSTVDLIRSTKARTRVNAKRYFYETVLNKTSIVFRLAVFLSVCRGFADTRGYTTAWEGLVSVLNRWHKLFFNAWFGRVWVVQEVANSKKTFLRHCKEQRTWNVATNLGRIQFEVSVAWRTNRPGAIIPGIFPHLDPTLVKWYMLWNEIHRLRQKEHGILFILDAARDFHATDPRDRIYALAELANELGPKEVLPDYSRSPAEVYHIFTRWLIHRHNSLDILSFCGNTDSRWLIHKHNSLDILSVCENTDSRIGPNQIEHTPMPSLPSWSPDYRHISKYRLGFTYQRTHYSPDGGRFPSVFPSTRSTCLRLGGVKLAMVSQVFEVDLTFNWPKVWPLIKASLDAPQSRGRTTDDFHSLRRSTLTLERFFRTLAADFNFEAGEYEMSVTRRTFAQAWRESHNTPFDVEMSWSEVNFLDRHCGERQQAVRGFEFSMCSRLMIGRHIFLTHDGRIGLGPRGTRAGDTVVTLFGGATLYVIRERDGAAFAGFGAEREQTKAQRFLRGPTWEFVGECYVDGRMYGEILEDLLFSDPLHVDPTDHDRILGSRGGPRGVYRRQIFCLE